MPFAEGQIFRNKQSGLNYRIYDIVGQGVPVPTETSTIFLELSSRVSILSSPQRLITITGRKLLDFFDPVKPTHK